MGYVHPLIVLPIHSLAVIKMSNKFSKTLSGMRLLGRMKPREHQFPPSWIFITGWLGSLVVYIQVQSSSSGTAPEIYFLSLLQLLLKHKNQGKFQTVQGRFPYWCWARESIYPADNSTPPVLKEFSYFILHFSSLKQHVLAVQKPPVSWAGPTAWAAGEMEILPLCPTHVRPHL